MHASSVWHHQCSLSMGPDNQLAAAAGRQHANAAQVNAGLACSSLLQLLHALPSCRPHPRAQAAEAGQAGAAGADLVLYRRMAEVKRLEQLVAIEDLMYICILEKFQVRRMLRFGWMPRDAGCLLAGRPADRKGIRGAGISSLPAASLSSSCHTQQQRRASVLPAVPGPARSTVSPLCSCCRPALASPRRHEPHQTSRACLPQEIGVDMLPRVEPVEESAATLRALTGEPRWRRAA